MFRTRRCTLLGIEMPIIAVPMGFITGPELAAAISNAGGLGILSFSSNPPDVLRSEIQRLRALTSKPVGVGVLLDGPQLPFPIEAIIDVCLDERIPALETFWGDPSPFVDRAHAVGLKIIDQVGSVGDAQRAAKAGVHVIVAQGMEAAYEGGMLKGFSVAFFERYPHAFTFLRAFAAHIAPAAQPPWTKSPLISISPKRANLGT